ncbi:TIGR01777 family oxidoreductase [Zhouia spongiae]|uniref:TIGR01777 family oxidoreductase n=1 Tax=Zhouia spongiae TaxID=2202721 RepID=A0ABY3YI58_9FLAO|nr:TIGR01777 family oxidoreductase [Zhouia spongiae]UNY97385.1 TIGR01777 family oxidoreductase [Zhouia spongiae]
MRILITGATGLIGREIVKLCRQQGIAVHYLTTDSSKIVSRENYRGFYWDTNRFEIDEACFKGVDAIINLAGSSIAKRWTSSYKKVILGSRVNSILTLKKGLVQADVKVRTIVSSSAIGIYPDSGVNYYEESFSGIDQSFLGTIVEKWEATAEELKECTDSLAVIRTGLVLSGDGGALPKMVRPVNNYVGSPFGNGQQWQSWIHITDLARIFLFAIKHQMSGVYNGVAPNPVTNEKLIRSIAEVLEKPILFPKVPAFILQFVLGEMSHAVLASQRVSSKKIQEEGFGFKYPNLQGALREIILGYKKSQFNEELA